MPNARSAPERILPGSTRQEKLAALVSEVLTRSPRKKSRKSDPQSSGNPSVEVPNLLREIADLPPDEVRGTPRKEKLAALVRSVPQNVSPTAQPMPRYRPKRSLVPPFPEGQWFVQGDPFQGQYRAIHLAAYWRGLFPQYRPGEEVPEVPFYLTLPGKVLDQWIGEAGFEACQAIVRFAMEQWDSLKFDLDMDYPAPPLEVIYGWRDSFAAIQKQREEQAGGRWEGGYTYAEVIGH
jgi:hypothetical protein